MEANVFVAIAVGADLASHRCPVYEHGDVNVALITCLPSPGFNHERNFGLRLGAAKERLATFDCVLMGREALAAGTAEPLRPHAPGVLAGGLQQCRSLFSADALASHAVEPGGGDDLTRRAAAAAVELRDQATQRLCTVREQDLVELHWVVPPRRGLAVIGLALRHR